MLREIIIEYVFHYILGLHTDYSLWNTWQNHVWWDRPIKSRLFISHKPSGVLDMLIKCGKRSKQSMTQTFLNISLRVSIKFPVWWTGSKKSVKSRYQTNIKDEVFICWSNLHLMGLFLWLWWWKNKRAKCNRWACHLFTHEAWWITSI